MGMPRRRPKKEQARVQLRLAGGMEMVAGRRGEAAPVGLAERGVEEVGAEGQRQK